MRVITVHDDEIVRYRAGVLPSDRRSAATRSMTESGQAIPIAVSIGRGRAAPHGPGRSTI
jgi:hypothetical protein